jgi:hypothetical protein
MALSEYYRTSYFKRNLNVIDMRRATLSTSSRGAGSLAEFLKTEILP